MIAKEYNIPLLDNATQRLAAAGIALQVTKKSVKNINFHLKPYVLVVSVPLTISAAQVVQAVDKRLRWALDNHAQVLAQYERRQRYRQEYGQLASDSTSATTPLILWGVQQTFTLNQSDTIAHYRQQLSTVTPMLFDKWQPIVGAHASEVLFKKMHTRWGSCNTRVGRIWLSVYLPAYPIECTEYVIVHELCHLHHANHSHKFWQTVTRAMPDYQKWHDMLAGKTGSLD